LTAREHEALGLARNGPTPTEVSNALGASVKTASSHRRRITTKFGTKTMVGPTKHALRAGLTKLEPRSVAGRHCRPELAVADGVWQSGAAQVGAIPGAPPRKTP